MPVPAAVRKCGDVVCGEEAHCSPEPQKLQRKESNPALAAGSPACLTKHLFLGCVSDKNRISSEKRSEPQRERKREKLGGDVRLSSERTVYQMPDQKTHSIHNPELFGEYV